MKSIVDIGWTVLVWIAVFVLLILLLGLLL